jgi:hypothetical protein
VFDLAGSFGSQPTFILNGLTIQLVVSGRRVTMKNPSPISCIRCNLNQGPPPASSYTATVEVPFCPACLHALGNPRTVTELAEAVVKASKKAGKSNVEKCLYTRLLYIWYWSSEVRAEVYEEGFKAVMKTEGAEDTFTYLRIPVPGTPKELVHIPGVGIAQCAMQEAA